MRIALLTDGIWPDKVGGMQKHSLYLAKYLSLNNIKVDLYYCADDHQVVRDQFTDTEISNIKLMKEDFPKMKIPFPGHYLIDSYLFSKRLYKLFLKQEPYDFVYAQGFTGWYFVKQNVRIGSNLHGLEMFQKVFGFKAKLIQLLLRFPARTIIRNSAVSFSLGGKLTDILKAQSAVKIKETPIGIGEEWLKPNTAMNEKICFAFVGRNEKRKGLDNLFKVLGQMDINQFRFHFIGIGKPSNMKDSNNLVFHGELKDAGRIREILSGCDCLVCPSIAEGMPTVILEAMSMGMAIIATDTGATSLLVDSTIGHLIQPNINEQLLQSLKYFISIDRSELQNLKDNSVRKVTDQYIWPVSIKTTIQALQL